jgi:kinesin family protein 11
MKCTFLEIYNEELEDLLLERNKQELSAPRKIAPAKPRLCMKYNTAFRRVPPEFFGHLGLVDDAERGSVCQGLTEVEITDSASILRVLADAEARCRYAETKLNKLSNRAHRIFTLLISFRRSEMDIKTSFTLADLAGSEDIARSGASGMV